MQIIKNERRTIDLYPSRQNKRKSHKQLMIKAPCTQECCLLREMYHGQNAELQHQTLGRARHVSEKAAG